MKPSKTTLDSLSDIERVETTGHVRRIGSQMLLALARKEVSAADIDAAARMITAQAVLIASEVKVARAAVEIRKHGASLGAVSEIGELPIGSKRAATTS